ncbi:MAG: hypothetical protein METHSR3v1_900002 [Methanothrix sp.]|nr:MAG: hypothetical protein METHSR3v1_900002 [Methanothrix sp.]
MVKTQPKRCCHIIRTLDHIIFRIDITFLFIWLQFDWQNRNTGVQYSISKKLASIHSEAQALLKESSEN